MKNKGAMKILNAVLGAALLALAGCGGGGGGDAGPQATTVSGTAAKGLVKQAKVLVCRIVDGVPEPDASCLSATTGSDGSYSVTFQNGYTGPVMVKVMPGSASTMMDEMTGTDIPFTMTMRAVVPAVSGSTTVYVTPFSEMAAHAAGMGMMNAASIGQSITAAQNAVAGLGIDLSVMPMMNLKSDGSNAAMLTMQANMAKQLARVAMAARTSSAFTNASGQPCYQESTDSQRIACVITAMAGMMTGSASFNATMAAAMQAALSAQNVTSVTMPMMRMDGTIDKVMVDMTSSASMQAALQQEGMSANMAMTMTNSMMGGMH